jgi:hypothetical protein
VAIHCKQLRLCLPRFADTLPRSLQQQALAGTELAQAQPQILRLKLLKVAATKRVTARKIWAPLPRSHLLPSVFRQAHLALRCRPHQQNPIFALFETSSLLRFFASQGFSEALVSNAG